MERTKKSAEINKRINAGKNYSGNKDKTHKHKKIENINKTIIYTAETMCITKKDEEKNC